MKRALLLVSLVLVILLVTAGVSDAQETLVFGDSFEGSSVGQPPVGWSLNVEGAATVVDVSKVSIPDGKVAVRLLNSPTASGQIYKDISDVPNGKMVVWFMQPSSSKENINIEVKSGDHRLVGIFITGSGNVRVRDAGVQSGNILNLPNDQWHEFVVSWNVETQIFEVSYIENGQQIAITGPEGAKFDPAYAGEVPNRISFDVSKRDTEKEAFFDNVRVYSLGK